MTSPCSYSFILVNRDEPFLVKVEAKGRLCAQTGMIRQQQHTSQQSIMSCDSTPPMITCTCVHYVVDIISYYTTLLRYAYSQWSAPIKSGHNQQAGRGSSAQRPGPSKSQGRQPVLPMPRAKECFPEGHPMTRNRSKPTDGSPLWVLLLPPVDIKKGGRGWGGGICCSTCGA